MKLFVINGPNLNMLGVREPDIYGAQTYAQLVRYVEAVCERENMEVECFQSNHEGELVDIIQRAYGRAGGLYAHERRYFRRAQGRGTAGRGGAFERRGRPGRLPAGELSGHGVCRSNRRAGL